MDTRKVLGIIFSILFVGAFTFVLCWGIINFNKVKDSMSSTGVYTEQDVNNAYQDGYDTALQDKQSYDELINSYRDTITTQTDQISQLSSQVTSLTNNNKDCINRITTLETQKSSLETQVENLITIKTNNETLISELNIQVNNLQSEVARLINSGYNNEQEIAQKNAQIFNLQNSVTQLQKTNELNIQTINNLNNQITSLNSQISEMTLQIQNNSSNATVLNAKIAELEKSVAYYEQYIASLENGEQVVATFEFNGSVYNIQIVNPNSLLSVTTPSSTEYVIFNYWTVNGVEIDLSTYKISQNTKIVADVTYRYKTEFIVNDEVYNSQIVTINNFATLPTNPSIAGYDFDGWTLNGIDLVDPNTTPIKQNTQFIAKFTKLHIVTFMYENEIIGTQTVRNGSCAQILPVENTQYKELSGWKLNDTVVDISNYKIVANTVFVANIIYSYDVEFYVQGELYNKQIVRENGYVTMPTMPERYGYNFIGWSIDNFTIVQLSSYSIKEKVEFVAMWDKVYVNLVDGSSFVNLIGTEVTSVVFDNYTNYEDKTYIVNGKNVISGIESVNVSDLNSNYTIDLYMVDSKAYILSVGKICANTNSSSMFYNCKLLTNLEFNNFYTHNVTDMSRMFYYCENLTVLNVSSFDTSNVTTMFMMFHGCKKVLSLDLSNFNTSKVTTMQSMFYNCKSATSINVSSFDTSNLTTMAIMFEYCMELETLDISNFDTRNVTSTYETFYHCPKLKTIYVSELWQLTSVTFSHHMFYNSSSLPNYNSLYTDATYAHYGEGGYLKYKAS